MSATSDAELWKVGADPESGGTAAELSELFEGVELRLGTFTDEELAAVAPVEAFPMAAYPLLEVMDPAVRDQVLGSAMRSLFARDLVRADGDPGDVVAVGALGTVLNLCEAPSWVLTAERVAEFDPSRRTLYGVSADGRERIITAKMLAASR